MEEAIKEYLFNQTTYKFAAILIGLVVIWTIINIARKRVNIKIHDSGSRHKTKKLITFAGYIVTIILFTVIYSNKLGNLTIAFGVAGAGIAFALQEVIASVAGWLAIVLGAFYKSGDRIQLGGIKGDVIDIGVLRTTIMETGQWVDGDLYNGRIVLIANSFVFKEPVFNYSGDFPFLWDEIKIPIMFGSDYDLAHDIILHASNEIVKDYADKSDATWKLMVTKYMIEDSATAASVSLVLNDNWVEFTLRYVTNYKKRRTTKNSLFRKILKDVEASNNKVKFASATFQLVEAPEINVNLKTP